MTGSATKAKQHALRLLGYRGRSERELRGRLAQKGFGDDIISDVVDDLKDAGLLNDQALAVHLRRYALENKRLGFEGARRFLLERGIDRATADSVVGFDEESEVRTIRTLAERRIKTGRGMNPSSSKKLWAFFVRRGFAPSSIRKALRTLQQCEEADL
ncbi:MAG: hypothetical protein OHK006_09690 [Thermodesulfovibrionales bacterium]